jgi:hypothetical protein
MLLRYSPYTEREENETREFKFHREFSTMPNNEMAIRCKSKVTYTKKLNSCSLFFFFTLSQFRPPHYQSITCSWGEGGVDCVENNKNSIRFQSRILLFHIPGRYTPVTRTSNYNYTVVPFSDDFFCIQ